MGPPARHAENDSDFRSFRGGPGRPKSNFSMKSDLFIECVAEVGPPARHAGNDSDFLSFERVRDDRKVTFP